MVLYTIKNTSMYYILYLNLKTKPHTIEGCSFSVWGWGRTGGRGGINKILPWASSDQERPR